MRVLRDPDGALVFELPEPVRHPDHPHIALSAEGRERIGHEQAADLLRDLEDAFPSERSVTIMVGDKLMAGWVRPR